MSAPAAPPVPPPERRHFPRRWHRARRALYGLLGLITLGAVAYVGLRSVEPPRLDLVMPTQARVGDVVILAGSGFSPRPEDDVVFVGDYAARVLEAARTRLLIEVPDMALDPGEQKNARVRVRVGSQQTVSLQLTVNPPAEPEPGANAPEDDDDVPPTPRPRVPGR
jgi:hypothetical protein